jgi:hypothetical protein
MAHFGEAQVDLSHHFLFDMGGDHLVMERASRFGRHILFWDASHNVSNIEQHLLVAFLSIVRIYT